MKFLKELKLQREEPFKISNIESDDKVKAFICTQYFKDDDYINNHYVIMATKRGQVKKTSLEQYSRPRTNGINAITIKDGDELLEAKLTTGESQVMLALRSGKAIRFEEAKTRPMGRNASGVRGITYIKMMKLYKNSLC